MRIILTKHAKKRMFERSIKIKEIQDTVDLPDYTITKGGKIESYRKINEKVLKVVHLSGDKFIKIVTLMWK